MVDGRVVLVDGLLDEPEPELVGVEVDVALRVAGDRRHVVDAFEFHVPPNGAVVISLSASSNTSVWRSTSGPRRRRRHQRHVVERREEHAAVERVQVHEALELEVARRRGLAPGARALGAEQVLGAAAELRHVPGHAVASIASSTPAVKRSPSAIIRSNASSVSTCSSVARIAASESAFRERPAHAADVDVLELDVVDDALGHPH